jgi:hypothetical protein
MADRVVNISDGQIASIRNNSSRVLAKELEW